MRARRRLVLAALLVAPAAAAETILHTERSLYRQIVVYDDDVPRFDVRNPEAAPPVDRQDPRALALVPVPGPEEQVR